MPEAHFSTPEELRAWLEAHHATETELWVRLPRKGSGEPGLTWPELVDEVLCFGWIDGHMKPIDDVWRRQRITPRRAGSKWSKRNVERVRVLTEEGRMRPAGLAAYEAGTASAYTYEAPQELSPEYAARLAQHAEASASARKRCSHSGGSVSAGRSKL